jgi:hypothetical protein
MLQPCLSGGLAGTYPGIVGEPYRDGDGGLYTPMIREPIFIYGVGVQQSTGVLRLQGQHIPKTVDQIRSLAMRLYIHRSKHYVAAASTRRADRLLQQHLG